MAHAGELNRFVTAFCRWADDAKHPWVPQRTRAALPEALRRAVLSELPSRDRTVDLLARDLESKVPRITISGQQRFLVPAPDTLWAVVAMPGWRRGWSDFSKDENIVQVVSDFFYLASQYVARSRIADLLGALALTYRLPLEFRFGSLHSLLMRSRDIPTTAAAAAYALQLPLSSTRQNRKTALVQAWLDELNCLDPYIHRIVFQYIRALTLERHHFSEEYITALDGVVDVATAFWRARLNGKGPDFRAGMAANLLTRRDADQLGFLYGLRCYFGAHPGPTKWWDFHEMYDDELNRCEEAVVRLIRAVALAERASRKVEPNPTCWSAWFQEHCLAVFQAVWFAELPA